MAEKIMTSKTIMSERMRNNPGLVFTLNLTTDIERWRESLKLWKSLGTEPIRVEGIVPSDFSYLAITKGGFIPRGLPCYRHTPHRNRDTCPDHCNNTLGPRQIGNSLGVRKLIHEGYKHLLSNPEKLFVILSEDDIALMISPEKWRNIFLPKIEEIFERYVDEPVLLGLSKYFSDDDYEHSVRHVTRSSLSVEPVTDTAPGVSNPCFALNRLAAEQIIRSRPKFDVLSDVEIWLRFEGITRLGLSHRPFKELSWSGLITTTLGHNDGAFRRTTDCDLVIVPPWTSINDYQRIKSLGLRIFKNHASSPHPVTLPFRFCNQTCISGNHWYNSFTCEHNDQDHGVRRVIFADLKDQCSEETFESWCAVTSLPFNGGATVSSRGKIWSQWARRLYPNSVSYGN